MLKALKTVALYIKNFFLRDWTLEEKVLVILTCVLLGFVKGFLFAPIKKGICVGCNNGNHNENQYETVGEDYWLDEED